MTAPAPTFEQPVEIIEVKSENTALMLSLGVTLGGFGLSGSAPSPGWTGLSTVGSIAVPRRADVPGTSMRTTRGTRGFSGASAASVSASARSSLRSASAVCSKGVQRGGELAHGRGTGGVRRFDDQLWRRDDLRGRDRPYSARRYNLEYSRAAQHADRPGGRWSPGRVARRYVLAFAGCARR